jgi:alpha-glucosidase
MTYEFLETLYPNSFPFILTRANAPEIGKYAPHWSGDNYGRFSFYKLSISEVLNFNLFEAPMTGADICGFGENTPEILCAKWYQMGSLYPFSRSHSHLDYYRKEPYAMGITLLETTRKSLKFRYSILKYYYSLFMLNKGTGTIFRPLFFEFYNDRQCLDNQQ